MGQNSLDRQATPEEIVDVEQLLRATLNAQVVQLHRRPVLKTSTEVIAQPTLPAVLPSLRPQASPTGSKPMTARVIPFDRTRPVWSGAPDAAERSRHWAGRNGSYPAEASTPKP